VPPLLELDLSLSQKLEVYAQKPNEVLRGVFPLLCLEGMPARYRSSPKSRMRETHQFFHARKWHTSTLAVLRSAKRHRFCFHLSLSQIITTVVRISSLNTKRLSARILRRSRPSSVEGSCLLQCQAPADWEPYRPRRRSLGIQRTSGQLIPVRQQCTNKSANTPVQRRVLPPRSMPPGYGCHLPHNVSIILA